MRDADFSGSCVTRSNKTQEGSILTYEKENDDSHIQRHGRTKSKAFRSNREVQKYAGQYASRSSGRAGNLRLSADRSPNDDRRRARSFACRDLRRCYVKGSGQIADKITEIIGIAPGETSPDGKYSFEATRCIGACGLAPVLTINGEVYGRLTVADIAGILKKYE